MRGGKAVIPMARKPKRDLTLEEQLARGPIDLPFLMLVLLLVGIGLIMLFSASYATAYYDSTVGNDPLYYFKRQALFAVAGIAVMYVVSKINYQTLRALSFPLLGGWSETKLFCVFSGLTLALCCLAFLGVMDRYPV